MIIKNFIPCIFLHEENAVRSIKDFTVVDTNPLRLVNLYNERGADKLIVFDLSADSKEKEKNLDVIRDICNTSEIPVIACGNIQNESDVNILFYAGCDKVVLDFDLQSNIQIAEKVSKKWGKNNLIAEISTPQAIQNYNEMIAAVTSELLIMNSHLIQQVTESTHLPYIVYIDESTLGRIIDICKLFGLSGVTGNVINDNINDVGSLKQICEANNVPINVLTPAFKWEDFKLNSDGMIPVIVQDYKTNEVLMLAYMNKEAYETTLKTGKMTYYSRSRRELWIKGLTSGHFQYVKSLEIDCDYDTILARVSQKGAACHTGSRNCFFNNITKRG